jgi:DNA polymerase III delta prime subunit
VKVEVIAGQQGSPEYTKSIELKEQFIRKYGDSEQDLRFAWIFPNHDCSSQKGIRDVDILVYADIRAYVEFPTEKGSKRCFIQNFVANIEVCNRDEWWREGSHVWVRYGGEDSDKTQQNINQVYALKGQIRRASEYIKKRIPAPRFESILWMTAIESPFPDDIKLHTLCANQGLDDILRIIAGKGTLSKDRYGEEDITYQAWRQGEDQKDIKAYLRDVYRIHENKQMTFGSVTRRQIDAVSGETLSKHMDYKQQGINGFLVMSGAPGTGKTITLLNMAYELLMEERNILFLTYNIALACDLRQMWWHLRAVKPVQGNLSVKSSFSFFGALWRQLGMELSGNEFLDQYEDNVLSVMHEAITSFSEREIQKIRRSNSDIFGCSKVLIDEGQDWDKREVEILEQIYGSQRILVAQSMSQLVRSNNPMNWHDWLSAGREKFSHLSLKVSMRQKENLLNYSRAMASHYKQKISLSKSRLKGGSIQVITGKYTEELHKELLQRHARLQATPYEFMFLVPNRYDFAGKVKNSKIGMGSSDYLDLSMHELRKTFEKEGDLYNQDRLRIINYQASRGLEAWTCVCLSIDRFYAELPSSFRPIEQRGTLLTQQAELVTSSEQEQLAEYLFNWLMIPLTRAIDTLVLHVEDPDSSLAKALFAAQQQVGLDG